MRTAASARLTLVQRGVRTLLASVTIPALLVCWSEVGGEEESAALGLDDEQDGTLPVTISGDVYYFPADYGIGECSPHDAGTPPYCDTLTDGEFDPLLNPSWCSSSWCYVDPAVTRPGHGAARFTYT